MPETGSQTYSYGDPAFVAQLQAAFPGLMQQIQGMLGGGGADTGALHGVGQQFQGLYGQLQEGPNATQQSGLDTMKQLMDMGYLKDAYRDAYGAITEPTLRNKGISGGLGEGAITEANALAGASAGVDIAKMQKDAGTNYGRAQLDVGSGLTADMLRALSGAGGVYSNEGQIQNQARGQDLGALSNLINSILGYRPQQTGGSQSAPYWPTNFGSTIAGIQGASGLIQKGAPAASSALNWLTGPGGGPGAGMVAGGAPLPQFPTDIPIDGGVAF